MHAAVSSLSSNQMKPSDQLFLSSSFFHACPNVVVAHTDANHAVVIVAAAAIVPIQHSK